VNDSKHVKPPDREHGVGSNGTRSMRVIVNGKNAEDPGLAQAVAGARRRGHRVEVRVTREEGDAVRFAAERPQDPPDVIVAAGGDGTVNEVLNGMLAGGAKPEPALAIVPLGTANDFARSCGIPQDRPDQALRLAWESVGRLVDVGCVNDRFFLNVATAGFGAEVAAHTPATAKKVLGGLAYAVTGLLRAVRITPYPCRLTLPDERWTGNLVVLTVGNGRQAGGGIPVAPKAALDDGLLDSANCETWRPRTMSTSSTARRGRCAWNWRTGSGWTWTANRFTTARSTSTSSPAG
jgi:lipid kinase YegS